MRRVCVEALSMQLIGSATRGRIDLPALRRRGQSRPHEHLRTTLFLWAIPALLWLTWLVVRGEPLPLDDVGSACVATVIYCVITIGAVHAGARLPPLSFP